MVKRLLVKVKLIERTHALLHTICYCLRFDVDSFIGSMFEYGFLYYVSRLGLKQ